MNELIDVVARTRETAATILSESLTNLDSVSEIEFRDRILTKMSASPELFPEGWYDPPPGGIGALFSSQKPFGRLQFDSLRKPESWPRATSRFDSEGVGIIYISPVDRATNMLGDIGVTIYRGQDEKIRRHIRECYNLNLAVAEHAEVGMKFKDLYAFAMELFEKKGAKQVGWMTTSSDPMKINLGHTAPGSFENDFVPKGSFLEVKDMITNKRIYINRAEEFIIPETCAFTVEVRLVDIDRTGLPNAFFHVIVTFSNGVKQILTDFDDIFRATGMAEYMQV